MTKTKRRPQPEFVTDEQQRLLEIEDARLVVKFGESGAIPTGSVKRSARSLSRPGSMTSPGATRTPLKRSSRSSTRSTRSSRRGP